MVSCWCLLHILAVMLILISASTHLTTFKTENLQISQPPFNDNVIDEAIWLVKSHYIKSYLYDDKFWDSTRKKLTNVVSKHAAIKILMEMLNDPYSRFIPETTLIEKRNAIRGEILTAGKSFEN